MPSAKSKSSKSAAPADDGDTQPARSGERESLSKRLPGMSDYQLQAYLTSATRISRDDAHPKSAAAKLALPKIENEIGRRAASGAARSPAREPIASPKTGKKSGRNE